MDMTDIAQNRYSTKAFDANKKIDAEKFAHLKNLMRLSPSSVNSQPWHFIIADTNEGIKRIAKAAHGPFEFNLEKITKASHVVVFCTKTHLDEEYMEHLLQTEEKDGRFATDPSFKEAVNGGRKRYMNIHRFNLKDAQHWMEKQTYLNMGTTLLGAAALDIDAVPIEGIDMAVINEEFELIQKGYTATVAVAFGYRDKNDFNAALPKSRRAEDELFTQA